MGLMENPAENPDLLTIAKVAQELGITPQSVHGALNQGRLPFVTLYGRKLISRADLDAYKLRTRPGGEKPRGRPRKERAAQEKSQAEDQTQQATRKE